jgi:hypothetical protein
MSLLFICLPAYAVAEEKIDRAVEDLAAQFAFHLKGVAREKGLENLAVWTIEADKDKLIDVRRLTTRLNIALIDAGLLREMAFDLTEIWDRNDLFRAAQVYGFSALVYGNRTTVMDGEVEILFQVFDPKDNGVLWEGAIIGRSSLLIAGRELLIDPDKWLSEVYIDDVRMGYTPLPLELTSGRYKLEIKKLGYKDWRSSLEIKGENNKPSQLRPNLKEEPWHALAKPALFIGAGGSGIASLVTFYNADQARKKYDSAEKGTPPHFFDEYIKTVNRMNTLTLTFDIVGILLLAGGIYFTIF